MGVAELRDVGSVRQFGVVGGRSEVKLANTNSSSVQAGAICAGGRCQYYSSLFLSIQVLSTYSVGRTPAANSRELADR